MEKDTSVKVAVRIRPLSTEEAIHEPILCLDTIPEGSQVFCFIPLYIHRHLVIVLNHSASLDRRGK